MQVEVQKMSTNGSKDTFRIKVNEMALGAK